MMLADNMGGEDELNFKGLMVELFNQLSHVSSELTDQNKRVQHCTESTEFHGRVIEDIEKDIQIMHESLASSNSTIKRIQKVEAALRNNDSKFATSESFSKLADAILEQLKDMTTGIESSHRKSSHAISLFDDFLQAVLNAAATASSSSDVFIASSPSLIRAQGSDNSKSNNSQSPQGAGILKLNFLSVLPGENQSPAQREQFIRLLSDTLRNLVASETRGHVNSAVSELSRALAPISETLRMQIANMQVRHESVYAKLASELADGLSEERSQVNSLATNVLRLEQMCEDLRKHQPRNAPGPSPDVISAMVKQHTRESIMQVEQLSALHKQQQTDIDNILSIQSSLTSWVNKPAPPSLSPQDINKMVHAEVASSLQAQLSTIAENLVAKQEKRWEERLEQEMEALRVTFQTSLSNLASKTAEERLSEFVMVTEKLGKETSECREDCRTLIRGHDEKMVAKLTAAVEALRIDVKGVTDNVTELAAAQSVLESAAAQLRPNVMNNNNNSDVALSAEAQAKESTASIVTSLTADVLRLDEKVSHLETMIPQTAGQLPNKHATASDGTPAALIARIAGLEDSQRKLREDVEQLAAEVEESEAKLKQWLEGRMEENMDETIARVDQEMEMLRERTNSFSEQVPDRETTLLTSRRDSSTSSSTTDKAALAQLDYKIGTLFTAQAELSDEQDELKREVKQIKRSIDSDENVATANLEEMRDELTALQNIVNRISGKDVSRSPSRMSLKEEAAELHAQYGPPTPIVVQLPANSQPLDEEAEFRRMYGAPLSPPTLLTASSAKANDSSAADVRSSSLSSKTTTSSTALDENLLVMQTDFALLKKSVDANKLCTDALQDEIVEMNREIEAHGAILAEVNRKETGCDLAESCSHRLNALEARVSALNNSLSVGTYRRRLGHTSSFASAVNDTSDASGGSASEDSHVSTTTLDSSVPATDQNNNDKTSDSVIPEDEVLLKSLLHSAEKKIEAEQVRAKEVAPVRGSKKQKHPSSAVSTDPYIESILFPEKKIKAESVVTSVAAFANVDTKKRGEDAPDSVLEQLLAESLSGVEAITRDIQTFGSNEAVATGESNQPSSSTNNIEKSANQPTSALPSTLITRTNISSSSISGFDTGSAGASEEMSSSSESFIAPAIDVDSPSVTTPAMSPLGVDTSLINSSIKLQSPTPRKANLVVASSLHLDVDSVTAALVQNVTGAAVPAMPARLDGGDDVEAEEIEEEDEDLTNFSKSIEKHLLVHKRAGGNIVSSFSPDTSIKDAIPRTRSSTLDSESSWREVTGKMSGRKGSALMSISTQMDDLEVEESGELSYGHTVELNTSTSPSPSLMLTKNRSSDSSNEVTSFSPPELDPRGNEPLGRSHRGSDSATNNPEAESANRSPNQSRNDFDEHKHTGKGRDMNGRSRSGAHIIDGDGNWDSPQSSNISSPSSPRESPPLHSKGDALHTHHSSTESLPSPAAIISQIAARGSHSQPTRESAAGDKHVINRDRSPPTKEDKKGSPFSPFITPLSSDYPRGRHVQSGSGSRSGDGGSRMLSDEDSDVLDSSGHSGSDSAAQRRRRGGRRLSPSPSPSEGIIHDNLAPHAPHTPGLRQYGTSPLKSNPASTHHAHGTPPPPLPITSFRAQQQQSYSSVHLAPLGKSPRKPESPRLGSGLLENDHHDIASVGSHIHEIAAHLPSFVGANTKGTQCPHCLKRYPQADFNAHVRHCDLRAEVCPKGCGQKVMIMKMQHHVESCQGKVARPLLVDKKSTYLHHVDDAYESSIESSADLDALWHLGAPGKGGSAAEGPSPTPTAGDAVGTLLTGKSSASAKIIPEHT